MKKNKMLLMESSKPASINQLDQSRQSSKILFSAYELVASKGYANVSIRDIADHAKVVLSQVNYYFKNKEGLMTAVVKMMSDKYIMEIEEVLETGTSSKEKMESLIQYYKDVLLNNPPLLRIFYDLAAMSMWSEKFGKSLDGLFEKLAYLIQIHIIDNSAEENMHKSHSSEGLSRMILGAMIGTAIQFLSNPNKERMNKSLDAIKVIFD